MALPKVLVTDCASDEHLSPLVGITKIIKGPEDGTTMARDEALRHGAESVAIINQGELRVDKEMLSACPNLKIVANVAIGINNLDLESMTTHCVWAANVPHAVVDSTADLTLGLLLTLTRRIVEADRFVRSGEWRISEPARWDGIELARKTMGIVGYGNIGQAVASRARAFGMKILFNTLHERSDPEWRPLDSLIAESDVLSLHTPLTETTNRLIHGERLFSMKPGSVLINMARGKVVDESALVECLQSGHLAGAGLDVFENEPKVHPALLNMPNVVLTPHIGGATREARKRARLHAAENVARVLAGKPPLTPVNHLDI